MKRLEHLNGLRGVAALVVVVHHFFYAFVMAAAKGTGAVHYPALERAMYLTPLQLTIAGNFAVCIFFCLSGFVLSYAFWQTGKLSVVQSGAIKRYFRLMPPILASVLLAWLIVRTGIGHDNAAAAISGAPWLRDFWPRSVSFLAAVWYGAYDIIIGNNYAGLLNNALWTMKIEFIGSMLLFGGLALFGKLRLRWLVYIALAITAWHTYYLAFVIGVALSDLHSRTWAPKTLSLPAIAALVAAGLFLGAAPMPGPTPTLYNALAWPGLDATARFVLQHIIAAGLLLAAFVYSPLLARAFSIRPLRYLGKISFSMYLVHLLVLGTITSYMVVTLNQSHGYATSLLISGAAYVLIVFIVSDIFTRYIDLPSIKFASWVGRRVMDPRNLPPQPAPVQTPKTLPATETSHSSGVEKVPV